QNKPLPGSKPISHAPRLALSPAEPMPSTHTTPASGRPSAEKATPVATTFGLSPVTGSPASSTIGATTCTPGCPAAIRRVNPLPNQDILAPNIFALPVHLFLHGSDSPYRLHRPSLIRIRR